MQTSKYLSAVILSSIILIQACGGSSSEPAADNPIAPAPVVTPVTPAPVEGEQSIDTLAPSEYLRIANGISGLEADIDGGDRFGRDHDVIGDVNGDGISDLILGARSDDDGAEDAGAVYILFMNADGSVNSNQKISMLDGGFDDTLEAGAFFGYGVAGVGDYDGDLVPDVAVSAPNSAFPALYIIHLNPNGTVKSMVKNTDIIAHGLSAIGDLNQSGRIDLVAANPNASDGGNVSIVFLNQDSTVSYTDTVTIGNNTGGFTEGINEGDDFGGRESALLGDLDGDGTLELAIGAFQSDNGLGAIWIVSLETDTYNVVDQLKIGPGLAGFAETIPIIDNANGTTGGHFGHAMVGAGDLNSDGVPDLITGANQYDTGVGYIIYLNADKSVKTFTRINDIEGGFALPLETDERFSRSMSISRDAQSNTFTVNMGGGADGSGGVYSLSFEICELATQGENTFWDSGITLYSNWDHTSQTVSDALSIEQCSLKSFENNGANITFNDSDGRCIVKDGSAVLASSEEGSTAFKATCP